MTSLLKVAISGDYNDRYHQQILADMQLSFEGLDPFWQQQYQKFQQITTSSSN
jgi:hypothetical protein